MDEIIPRLNDLLFRTDAYDVPDGFAANFVKLHMEDWRKAQKHWEEIVAAVLDSTAVDRRAYGLQAMKQAVAAASILLFSRPLKHRCPVCVNPAKVRRLGPLENRGREYEYQ